MSYLIVDVLGFTGVAGEKKGTLGDSSLGEDFSIGQYASAAEAKQAAKSEKILALMGAQGITAERPAVGGGGMYNPLNNRPMNR